MDNLEPGEGYRFIDTAVDEPQEGAKNILQRFLDGHFTVARGT